MTKDEKAYKTLIMADYFESALTKKRKHIKGKSLWEGLMKFKIGDYVEGYRTAKKRMSLTYTKGWVVKVEYTGRKLVELMINEDADRITGKYGDSKEVDFHTDVIEESVNLVVDDVRYPVNKIQYEEDWGERNYSTREHILDMQNELRILPYHIDESLLKIKGTVKIFRLDSVLQIPNSSYTDNIHGGDYACRPVDKMLEYVKKYSYPERRVLMIDTELWTPDDLSDYMRNNVACVIQDLFVDNLIGVDSYENKALAVDDIANANKGMDCLVIDSDVRLITEIQNRDLFTDQARNLRAVHPLMIMDMEL